MKRLAWWAAFVCLWALASAPALAVQCTVPGVSAWHCAYAGPGDNRSTATQAVEQCRLLRAATDGAGVRVSTLTWNGSDRYNVVWTSGATTSVIAVGTPPGATDPNAVKWTAGVGFEGCDLPPVTPEQCEALASNNEYKNPASLTIGFAVGAPTVQCRGGCEFSPLAGSGTVETIMGTSRHVTGNFGFNGNVCAQTTDTPPVETALPANAPKEQCGASGSLTVCTQANGDHCITATTGRRLCWRPTETGLKRDSTIAQKKTVGTEAQATPVIAGSTVAASGTAATITVTSGSTTTTYTIQNYTTSVAAPSNEGEATTNDKASGGSCTQSYMCSGDMVKCAQLEEARKTRCAVEEGKTGISGAENCATPPVCAGTKCQADAYFMVLQQWKTRCAAETANEKLDAIKDAIEGIPGGSGDGTADLLSGEASDGGTDDGDPTGPGGPEGQGLFTGSEVGGDGLDDEGLGWERDCLDIPPINFQGHSFQPDLTLLCTGADIESWIMLAVLGFFLARWVAEAV